MITNRAFSSFSEALDYSKEAAVKESIVFQISRNGNYWDVYPSSKRKEYEADKEKDLLIKEKDRISDELTQEKEELERLKQQTDELTEALVIKSEKEAKDRKQYLKTKFDYFLTLEKDELEDLWNDQDTLLEDEKKVLRSALRNKLNISMHDTYAKPTFCKQCGMVGSNCTCSRSWF